MGGLENRSMALVFQSMDTFPSEGTVVIPYYRSPSYDMFGGFGFNMGYITVKIDESFSFDKLPFRPMSWCFLPQEIIDAVGDGEIC